MALTIVTPPAVDDPVLTFDEAKSQSRVLVVAEKDLIDAMVVASTEYAEGFTHRQFVTATWKLSLDRFPLEIRVPWPPLRIVNSIKYIDCGGVEQTLDASKYQVDTFSEPGRIVPAWGDVFPDTRRVLNAVTVEFDAGYGDASSVPQNIKQALLLTVADWFVHREDSAEVPSITKIPLGAEVLLLQERVWFA